MTARGEAPDLARRVALTLPETAAALGISERHVRAMMSEIPHMHVGRRVLVPVDGLRVWANRRAEQQRQADERVVQELLGGERL